ncbi:cytochrome P450 93A3-like [Dioscorea cayenensis subsp. rotundata]|uniref:Cytochrome P450 93A3-like n=1 Tax=Dioscorea cayennensis subsp. rotundata TaxID=55577 RepID=A0AB40BEV2_DIOCR|nr:cytochrome P450 93A3-like [Dioscorea cayenensis subsp. rotundata]
MIEENFKVNPKSFAIFTSITILSIIILRWLISKPARTGAGLRLPPSPIGLPIIGHLHLLAPIPHQALHKLSLRYGPLIFLRLGSVPCVVASSPETAKEFLKTHELFFADRPQSKAVSYLTYGSADFSYAPFGAYWKFMKKLSMSQLLGGQTLEQLNFIRKEEVVRFLRILQMKAKEKMKVDLSGDLIRMSNNVICRMTMSRRCSENEGEAEEVRKLVEETAEIIGKFNLADYISFCKNFDLQGFDKRLEDVRRRFDHMMEGILEEKKAAVTAGGGGTAVKDILDILLDIHKDENAEMKLSLENIKAYILDIFAAGTDTSALTIEWALSELINNPSVLEKLREEIDTVVGKNRLISEADISSMPYLQAIVKETLRLHPTGPMTVRECTKDCEINGYNIQAKTRLFVNIWAIGRDPDYWKEPLKFMPERFMEEGCNGIDVRGQHFHMLPFGSGRRVCPGASLALLVVHAGLGALVQCFDWEVDGMVDMTEGPGLTLPRAKPLVCTPVLRLNLLPLLA